MEMFDGEAERQLSKIRGTTSAVAGTSISVDGVTNTVDKPLKSGQSLKWRTIWSNNWFDRNQTAVSVFGPVEISRSRFRLISRWRNDNCEPATTSDEEKKGLLELLAAVSYHSKVHDWKAKAFIQHVYWRSNEREIGACEFRVQVALSTRRLLQPVNGWKCP